MNVEGFRDWLIRQGMSSKLRSDCISRVKRLETEFNNCDIDELYRCDGCAYLISMLEKNGKNEIMQKHANVNLPVGKYSMGTYRSALKRYIQYISETNEDKL